MAMRKTDPRKIVGGQIELENAQNPFGQDKLEHGAIRWRIMTRLKGHHATRDCAVRADSMAGTAQGAGCVLSGRKRAKGSSNGKGMTDAKPSSARRLFASDTPGTSSRAGCWRLRRRERAKINHCANLLSPLRDAVLYARAQRRPWESVRHPTKHRQARHCGSVSSLVASVTPMGFGSRRRTWTTGQRQPKPATRIALELLRLAYAIADKVRT